MKKTERTINLSDGEKRRRENIKECLAAEKEAKQKVIMSPDTKRLKVTIQGRRFDGLFSAKGHIKFRMMVRSRLKCTDKDASGLCAMALAISAMAAITKRCSGSDSILSLTAQSQPPALSS